MSANEIAGCSEVYPTMAVSNLQRTIDYYQQQLGFEVEFIWGDPPVHAGVKFGGATLHFNQSDGRIERGGDFWLYFVVEDLDSYFDFLDAREVELLDKPTLREWGMREINIRDVNGTVIRFGQWEPSSGDPVAIKRVDVNTRIEQRLAGLLQDLAEHKGMSVGQVLEETLLHSFETVDENKGSGVANPHTQRTMKFIDELKKKHSIDYDLSLIHI